MHPSRRMSGQSNLLTLETPWNHQGDRMNSRGFDQDWPRIDRMSYHFLQPEREKQYKNKGAKSSQKALSNMTTFERDPC